MEIKNNISAPVAYSLELEQGENPVPAASYSGEPGEERGTGISTPDYTVSVSSEGKKLSESRFRGEQRSERQEFDEDQRSVAQEELRRVAKEEALFENNQQREELTFEANQRMERMRFMQRQNTRAPLINQIA